jgi:hypothetical protein
MSTDWWIGTGVGYACGLATACLTLFMWLAAKNGLHKRAFRPFRWPRRRGK